MPNNTNRELDYAASFINDTGYNIFLTGKAGTGKTTFLQKLKKFCQKRLIVTAPTGVAAINAKGVTLHSFFQLPFGPILPGHENNQQKYRFGKEKLNTIKSLDLLIIDEISMVRADLLDGVDSVLRRIRRSSHPFGGVQLLLIGDLFQLPPVVKDHEWQMLAPHYSSPYFFTSHALGKKEFVTIELQRIYRQEDVDFIHLLNEVRSNSLKRESLNKLNTRVLTDFTPHEDEGYITLCSHNSKADFINAKKLDALSAAQHSFSAQIDGEFPEHTYPTHFTLQLKEGAQVMFMRNDQSPEKRYFNGKIGTITEITNNSISIKCPDDPQEIVVEKSVWENVDYFLDPSTQEITERTLGSFSQYPLRLAWAITIHKSQGLTFDKAIIDAQAAFAHGQVYVALSRCRTFQGLVLSTPIPLNALKCDNDVISFNHTCQQKRPTDEQLQMAKIGYQQQLILECYSFQNLRSLLRRLVYLCHDKKNLIHLSSQRDLHDIEQKVNEEIYLVGENFRNQLWNLFPPNTPPTKDNKILERLSKASLFFKEKFEAHLLETFSNLKIESDNKEIQKKARNHLKYLNLEIRRKFGAITSCSEGFSPSCYFRAISAAEVETVKKKREINKHELLPQGEIQYPNFFEILKGWRSEKAQHEKVANFQILHQKTLVQIAIHIPTTIEDLRKIKGIGKRLAEKYGEELTRMAQAFRSDNKIVHLETPEVTATITKRQKKTKSSKNTKEISLELYDRGLTQEEISQERELALATINKHLAYYITTGRLKISAFLTPEKQKRIGECLKDNPHRKLREIKDNLGSEVSYSDIEFMIAQLKFEEKRGG